MRDATTLRRSRRAPVALALVTVCCLGAPTGAASGAPAEPDASWTWPLTAPRIARPYETPAHDYAPGHRGIDLRSPVSPVVVAPDAGVIAFAGAVADRSVVTIDHGDGVVSTLEPVDPVVAAGTRVARGAVVGEVATGGHASPGTLHLGARLHGQYVNPMLFLGGVPRAVLLPCC